MNTNFIIGLCGHARSGKDTFCELAKAFLSEKEVGAARVAFADQLKKDLDELCRHKIGCSAFTDDPEEKKIIRPLLVTYGTDVMRKLDENCWIDKLEKNLYLHQQMQLLPIVTDVRYPNEMEWVRKHNGANKEEKVNNSILKKGADYRIMWPSFGKEEAMELGKPFVRRVMNKIFKSKIKC